MNKITINIASMVFLTLLSFNAASNTSAAGAKDISIAEKSFNAIVAGLESSDFSSYEDNVFYSQTTVDALNKQFSKTRKRVEILGNARKKFSTLLSKMSEAAIDATQLEYVAAMLSSKEDEDWPDSSYLIVMKEGDNYYSYDLKNCTNHTDDGVSCSHVAFFKKVDERMLGFLNNFITEMKAGKEQDCSKICVVDAR